MAGEGSLLKRPTGMIIEALTQLGVTCITPDENNTLLLAVKGPLKGGNKITIDGSQTSQLLSGLFFALPLADKDSEITVKNLQSKSYVDMTIQVLSRFGIVIREETDGYYKIRGDQYYFSQTCTVEGDWSAAAFLLVVAALRGGATVYNIFGTSKQPDSAILKILMLTGANVELNPMSISVSRSMGTLKPFHFDASGCPDLFPPLVALAAYCKGISVIHGIDRLKTKECDRALALQEEFAKLGIKIELEDNYMKIFGGQGVHGGVEVSSHGDHRIAMSLAVAATGADMPVSIEGAACVKKSYPNFFEDLKRVHIEVKTDNDIADDTTTAMKNE
jgi:3-phosphoshikimate 1-carboxyvinyltransferase